MIEGKNVYTEAVPGAGLGLALARELARAFNGDVTLEEASTGARFVLSLPLRTTK